MDSKTYWAKREQEALKHRVKDEAQYDREIKKIYRNMLDQCQKEIESFFTRYAKSNGISLAEAKKRVSKLDIERYERKAEKYVKDREFSKEANEEMRLYNLTMKVNRLEMLKANIGLELISGHNELQRFMGSILKGRTKDELKRQAGILGKTVRDNAKTANQIVNASFHNATFSTRLWANQSAMKADLDKLLQSGLIAGKNPRVLAKDIEKYFIGDERLKNGKKGAVYTAERLLRTELARVQTEAQKVSFLENGFEEYLFVPLGDCCDICREVQKKHDGIYKIKNMMPGENAPPLHPLCRCSIAPYEDDAEYEAWIDFLDKGGTTEEWNKSEKAKWKSGYTSDYESDIGKKVVDAITGLSKQKKEFVEHLDKLKNKDVKTLLKQAFERTTFERAKGKRSKYSPTDKLIRLAKRATKSTIAHELFHEIDLAYGLTENGLVKKSVREDFKRLQNLAKGYGKTIEEMLYSRHPEAFVNKELMKEEYRAIADIINGMSKGEINLGYYHEKDYWEKEGKLEAETFAQFGRALFEDNAPVLEMMKEVFPDSYDEIIGTIERMIK